MAQQIFSEMEPSIYITETLNRLLGFFAGIVGITLGFIAVRKKQRFGTLGIWISLVLVILSMIPILEIVLSNSAHDINLR